MPFVADPAPKDVAALLARARGKSRCLRFGGREDGAPGEIRTHDLARGSRGRGHLAHADFVRGLARALVSGDADVDDVVQETWVAALGSLPRRVRSAQDLGARDRPEQDPGRHDAHEVPPGPRFR